jgi:uncharacterized phiE125 gp8 family phage protein
MQRRGGLPHAVVRVVTPPAQEPLTVTEVLLLSGLSWPAGDPREALVTRYIAAARSKVEYDTGLALLTQTLDLSLDAVCDRVIHLPTQPLQSVTSVQTIDTGGATNTLDPSQYHVDLVSARIGLSVTGAWPSDLRPFQPWVISIVVGYVSIAAIPPLLLHAVGLLAAHYTTLGRDVVTTEAMTAVPYGYAEAIAPHTAMVLG